MLAISSTLKSVLEKTLPLTVGLFAIMSVQLIDAVFIGKLGVNELTVQGITMPFQAAFIGIQVGIGVAATSIISHAFGANDTRRATNTASLALLVGSAFIALIGVTLWLMEQSVFSAFISVEDSGTQYQQLEVLFGQFWGLWLLSALSSAVLYLMTCVYRANGDTKVTGSVFVIASLINLVLDPIFMFVLNMGIAGAALASMLGFVISAGYMMQRAKGRHWFAPFSCALASKEDFNLLIKTTIPTMMNQILPSVSAFVTVMFIAHLGTNEIAFWSLLNRVESFLLIFTLALTMSLPPMIGRQLGAERFDSIQALVQSASRFVILFHLVIATLLVVSLPIIVPLLSADNTMQDWLKLALWVIPFSYGPLGLCMVVTSIFNALGKPKTALFVCFVRLLVLYIPAIAIGSLQGDIFTIVIAATIANVLAGLFSWLQLTSYVKQNLSATHAAMIEVKTAEHR
ncbi:MATE family efflux transporter [Vibrio harveyi]|uniref:MATE family efflux transporter n=1 Tax=Vibrio harveyi TaxID=669 RepID=UPI0023802542|nr:MATE family efflux transporter [Vibrio harveyi]